MRPVTLHLISARFANRHQDVTLSYAVTVTMWPSVIASMRVYYREQRQHLGYPEARMVTLAQFAIDWQRAA